MERQEVIALMQTSRNETEWNANCDTVKKNCGGYPQFWYEAIMLSGIANKVRNGWLSTAVRGNLVDIMPQQTGSVQKIELLPPTDTEIAEIRANNG
jgi:hypothetical protein